MALRKQFVRAFQRNHRWFKASDEVLKTLFAARGGGRLSMALAMFSSVGTAMELLYPADDGYTVMRGYGLHDPDLTIGGYLCEVLLRHLPNEIVAASQWGTTTHLWRRPDGSPLVGAMFQGPKYADGPFIAPGTLEEVYALARDQVWEAHSELKLDVIKSSDGTWRGAGRFHLTPMGVPGPYIGKKRPEWFADRLARFPTGRPLTALLRGPTGVGKSVLARHIAKLLRPMDARVLKVSSEVLKKCRSDEIKSLVRWLQPTVLLLDDLDFDSDPQFFLDLLETLRDPNTLVIVTRMTKFADKEAPKPGCWHFPGMRPGRVDLILTLGPPDEEERGWILDHYAVENGLKLKSKLRKAILKKTEGLTGAYLELVVLRLATLGVSEWEDEVNQVLYTAPFESEEAEDEDEDEDNEKTKAKKKAKDRGAESPVTPG